MEEMLVMFSYKNCIAIRPMFIPLLSYEQKLTKFFIAATSTCN